MANGRKAREYEPYLVESWRLQTMPTHESKRMKEVHEADAKPCVFGVSKKEHIQSNHNFSKGKIRSIRYCNFQECNGFTIFTAQGVKSNFSRMRSFVEGAGVRCEDFFLVEGPRYF